MKLVVLGPSQSGKTCLAVGLANSSYGKALFKRAFVASASGTASRNHLKELRLMLEGSEWPGATKDLKARTLDFEFQWKGARAEFSFDDYNGENVINKEFRNRLEDLGEEDGVALLVNPGFSYSYVEGPQGTRRFASDAEIANGATDTSSPVLTASAFDESDLARKWLAEQEGVYEQLIKDLSTKNGGGKTGKPIVALTITASDRLKSDLAQVKPQFESFLNKIKNRLDAGGFKWEPFEVSITGVLSDQSKPKLAGIGVNTSAKPFLWLLRKLAWRIRLAVWVKRAIVLSAVAAAIALCVGAYAWIAAAKSADDVVERERSCENSLAKAESNSANAEGDLRKAIGEYKKLREYDGLRKRKATDCADRLEHRIFKVQERLINNRLREMAESQGEMGSVADFNKVEELFSLLGPSSQTNETAKAYRQLLTDWELKKPAFKDSHDAWCLRERVQGPLRGLVEAHGTIVLPELYRLYDNIPSVESQSKIASVRMEVSSNLDFRVETEWKDFAIPDFDKCAATNATHEATRIFVKLLEIWAPVTTNGVVAKEVLFAQVTNSVPRWRTTYETTTFSQKIDKAVQSAVLEDLAVLYPQRVMERDETNDYLTVAYVATNWDERVKGEFSQAVAMFEKEVLASIMRRRGRPHIEDSDMDQVKAKGRSVGAPFDAGQIITNLKVSVAKESNNWEISKRKECTDWVQKNVSASRKRIGQGGLWDDYEKFSNRSGADNPFIDELVRPAVYAQVERWLEDDVSAFGKLDCRDEHYEKDVTERFDGFNRLCRRLNEDKNPLKTSWAWYFARDCCARAKTDRIGECFPRELNVTKVEGRIDYNDFRIPYNGTDLTSSLAIKSLGGKFEERMLVSAQTLGKGDNHLWRSIQFSDMKIRFHPFDVLTIRLKAIDKAKVLCGRDLECDVEERSMPGVCLNDKGIPMMIGGEFDLMTAKLIKGVKLTTKDPTPDAFIKMYGTLSGDSIEDYMVKAKHAAELEKQAK